MIKVKKRKILLLPGDGIGPEVIGEVKKIIKWFNDKKSLDFEMDEDLAGGCSYDKHGSPITDEVFYKALESEVVMLGAVGGLHQCRRRYCGSRCRHPWESNRRQRCHQGGIVPNAFGT